MKEIFLLPILITWCYIFKISLGPGDALSQFIKDVYKYVRGLCPQIMNEVFSTRVILIMLHSNLLFSRFTYLLRTEWIERPMFTSWKPIRNCLSA